MLLGQVPLRATPWLSQAAPAAGAALTASEVAALDSALQYLSTREGMRYIDCPRIVRESYAGPRVAVFPDPKWLALKDRTAAALASGTASLSLSEDEAAVARIVLDCYVKDQERRRAAPAAPEGPEPPIHVPIIDVDLPPTVAGIPTKTVLIGAGALLLLSLLT